MNSEPTSTQSVSIGISSCPNDTFSFYSLLHETNELTFNLHIRDIETLNIMAAKAELDVTKLSVGALVNTWKHYDILDSGAALGFGNGPLLVNKQNYPSVPNAHSLIAVPGYNTTAFHLLTHFFPFLHRFVEVHFAQIETFVAEGKADYGLLIHESRFTYTDKGLDLVADLGKLWENKYHLPLPLGVIAVVKNLDASLKKKINESIKISVSRALENPDMSRDFVRKYAQELSDDIIQKHIQLYVNSFSTSLGIVGKKAIQTLLQVVFPDEIIHLTFVE